ncbi:polyserase-2-like [Eucyclogobius newberryi]|uniref:polyserase-2-like n=1 Tax=Eucyclogobius newberryi TaxID=166745 RepID=UPI003B5A5FE4
MRILCVFSLLFTGSVAQLSETLTQKHVVSSVCGKPPLNTRIVGGEDAPTGAWPWQVSIHRGGGHICGGSLINNEWVLSAAHCFQSGKDEDNTVFLGRKSQEGSNPNEVSRSVTLVINHPDYDRPVAKDNDVALLKMASAVTFTDYIQPVCLAASGSALYAGTNTWVTGWGDIGSRVSLPSPKNLQEVEVPIVGNRQCFCDYDSSGITDNMLCAGLPTGGKDSCQGDSGGPQVSKQNGRWIQAGVVSFGIGCALAGKPGVYARVSKYQTWINNQIKENKPGFISFTSTGTDSDLSVTCSGLPPVPTSTTPASTTASPVVCGRASLNSRLSGASVSAGQWPWMASVQKNQVHVCGGTLVSEDAVLSDASCFPSSLNVTGWSVVLGRLHQNGSNPQEVRESLRNISVSNSSGSNVAVLHLASKPSLSNYIQPICLDDGRTFTEGMTCFTAGWSQGEGEQTLQEIQTSVKSCGSASTSDTICTGLFTLQQEDYGGPLMCKLSGSWFQAVVLANKSSTTTRASVLTFDTVSSFKSFLTSTLGTFLSPTATTTSAPNSTVNSTSSTTNTGLAHTGHALLLASHLLLALLGLLLCGSVAQLSVCGKPPLNTRIVGGEDAPTGAWPWQVSIHRGGGHICGGSLINNEWVLSAAHCFQRCVKAKYTVFLGRKSQEGSNPNEVSRSVTLVINHPDYNNPVANDNDVALLKMASAVTFTDYIQPVCLAASGSALYAGTNTWVTGWGDIGSRVSLPSPKNLQEVEVPIVGNRQCFCDYDSSGITDNMLCAGLPTGGKDSCQGDSGGPQVSKQNGRWIQAGVVSFGIGCALAGKPGVYARVSKYQTWINNQIKENKPGFISFTSTGTDSDLSVTCSGLPPVPTSTTPASTTASPVVCGRASLNSRLSGASVSAGQWPWMASVQKNQVHVCGGTLVSEDAVLSDASCFPSSLNVTGWSVVLGRLHQNGSNPQEVRESLRNISVSNSSGSNVAVLHLASKPSLSNYIQPICLDDGRTFTEGMTCFTAGWSQGEGEQTLQEIQTSVKSCGSASTSDTICTGLFTLQQEDYGGPLMCKLSGSWFQAVVLANKSSTTTRASVLTFDTVSSFKSFLTSTLGTFLSPTATTTSAPNSTVNSTSSTTNTGLAHTGHALLLASHLLLALLGLLLCG